jgi:hypothetical protein
MQYELYKFSISLLYLSKKSTLTPKLDDLEFQKRGSGSITPIFFSLLFSFFFLFLQPGFPGRTDDPNGAFFFPHDLLDYNSAYYRFK